MDPGGLLLSIAAISDSIDALSESYNAASSTLGLVRSQIKILEAGTQRIQEWLHFTDPTDHILVWASLGVAIGTVNTALERLQDDVVSTSHTGANTAKVRGDQWARAKSAHNEGRLRVDLTDVRECCHLMHFSLQVCQLPSGQTAAQEVRELAIGAKTLQRAQISPRSERLSVLQDSSAAPSELHSDDYNNFMASVMAAEEELPEESLARPRYSTIGSYILNTDVARQRSGGRTHSNELFLHSNGSSAAQNNGVHVLDQLAAPRTLSPDSTVSHVRPGPDRQSSHNTLIREINTMLGEPSQEPVGHSTYPPPDIPTRSSQRPWKNDATAGASKTYPPLEVQRKPVSRHSVSGDLSILARTTSGKAGQFGRDSSLTSSPAASLSSSTTERHTMTEKLTPLTESLRSLSSSDYINVELDQPPTQPYVDRPPAYESSSSRVAPASPSGAPPRTRRRGTGGSSFSRIQGVSVVQYVRENRLSDITSALKDGYNVNESDPATGVTPIMEAARYRRWDAARLLLKSGAKLRARDKDGNTALHFAAKEGDTEMCQMLLDAGAHGADCNKLNFQPLQLAVTGGHTETVLCLVNAIPYLKTNDDALVEAFLSAVKLGDTATAQAILAKGVKPKKMKESWRLTGYAAQSGSLPMLELVLNQKASLKDRSPQNYTPLHFASQLGHQPMVEKLLSLKVPWKAQTKKTDESALHLAAAAGHTDTALALAAHKDAAVNVQDADDQEPVHLAVRKGDMKLFTALVERGATLKTTNSYGWKPIHIAAAYGHGALLAECMTRGISIEEKLTTPDFKPEKRTNQAARRGYWAEIRWPHAGSRPLHLALEFGHDVAANTLIYSGAKLEESDSRGWRPLHMAAWSCRSDIVELLLQKGVSVEAKTVDGHTALGLGFRAHGLSTDELHRRRIYDMLSMAMAHQKPSMLRQLSSIVSSGPSESSRTAHQRNLAWHTAQLAEALFHPGAGQGAEGDDVSESLDGSDIGLAVSDGLDRSQEELYQTLQGSSRAPKG
ncbi:hypothetical protein B0A54_08990 [Friedmanniomyces endolithicus]|uniref:Uncharacterized protein n=1 Tax=Friedmanniomyces endolithicus TaxID=329885 RepID=A0A4U0UX37_9PEZI|nr:hypothetical protein LTS09_002868 [Friedmanniomyces endolithicus]TKA40533.1 hypothetical protein B0A54_08990 [Friedmanniomyces endolithicus]